jgi:hypothetical protein
MTRVPDVAAVRRGGGRRGRASCEEVAPWSM